MTPSELSLLTRTTLRELYWWSNTGVIGFTRTARGRDFDRSQALIAAIVAELRYKGVSLHRIRGLGIIEPLGEYLVVYGTMALWCGGDDVIPCLAACPGACLVVSVEDLRKRLYDQDSSPRRSRN